MTAATLLGSLQFLGVSAPLFVWIACLVVFGIAVSFLGRLWRQVRRGRAIFKEATAALEAAPFDTDRPRGDGLAREAYDALDGMFQRVPFLSRPGRLFLSQVISVPETSGDSSYFATDSAETTFSETAVIEPLVNRNLYNAVPGILTSIGLLVTFLAILLALLDVRIVATRVEGLDLLISGLSGKFVSSIAALFAATVFVVFERSLLHSLNLDRRRLLARLDAVVPRISAALLLTRLHHAFMAQSDATRAQNESQTLAAQQSLAESLGAATERMTATSDALGRSFKQIEGAQRDLSGDSSEVIMRELATQISGEIEGLTVVVRTISDQIGEVTNRRRTSFRRSSRSRSSSSCAISRDGGDRSRGRPPWRTPRTAAAAWPAR